MKPKTPTGSAIVTIRAGLVVAVLMACLGGARAQSGTSTVAPAPERAPAQVLKEAYVVDGEVYAVGSDGGHWKLTESGKCSDAKLAVDYRSVGWLISSLLEIDNNADGRIDERYELEQRLRLYRDGAVVRDIELAPDIRGWDFRDDGRQVAVAYGALHGPSFYALFEVATGKQVHSATDADGQLPVWAQGLE